MKILFAGEGGQGIQLTAEVLAHAAFLEGKESSLIPNFGVEQRGGVSLAFVIVDEEASYPKFDKADILAIFCDRAQERTTRYIDKETKIIYGPGVTGKGINDEGLPPQVWNILVLGKIIDQTGLVEKKNIWLSLKESLAEKLKKNPQLEEVNLKALGL